MNMVNGYTQRNYLAVLSTASCRTRTIHKYITLKTCFSTLLQRTYNISLFEQPSRAAQVVQVLSNAALALNPPAVSQSVDVALVGPSLAIGILGIINRFGFELMITVRFVDKY